MAAALSCGRPPPGDSDEAASEREARREAGPALTQAAHRRAWAEALPSARAALAALDPLAAFRSGHGPAAKPPLTLAARAELRERVAEARRQLDGIDEAALLAEDGRRLRALRFALDRAHDELHRRPQARLDPVAALAEIDELLATLRLGLLRGDCGDCLALVAGLDDDLLALRHRLTAASPPAVAAAVVRGRALAEDAASLAEAPALAGEDGRDKALREAVASLVPALEAHAAWLEQVAAALPDADHHLWTADPPPLGPPPARRPTADAPAGAAQRVERLPAVLGARALLRRSSVEARLELDPPRDLARITGHARRWQAMHEELVGAEALPDGEARELHLPRCEAALARLRNQLAAVAELPEPQLDCRRYLASARLRPLTAAELTLALVDAALVEPRRRAQRAAAPPELALIAGDWATPVHRHLRRVMILAQLDEPAALSAALVAGRRDLCLAGAALWIHAELGPADALAAGLGPACADLTADAAALRERVVADPRASLAGFGLSLIGDDPSQLAAYDRFAWVPLGLVPVLASDRDGTAGVEPQLEVAVEEFE